MKGDALIWIGGGVGLFLLWRYSQQQPGAAAPAAGSTFFLPSSGGAATGAALASTAAQNTGLNGILSAIANALQSKGSGASIGGGGGGSRKTTTAPQPVDTSSNNTNLDDTINQINLNQTAASQAQFLGPNTESLWASMGVGTSEPGTPYVPSPAANAEAQAAYDAETAAATDVFTNPYGVSDSVWNSLPASEQTYLNANPGLIGEASGVYATGEPAAGSGPADTSNSDNPGNYSDVYSLADFAGVGEGD